MTLLRRAFLGLGPALGAALAWPRAAEATTLRSLSLEELVKDSRLVVESRAVASRSEWSNAFGKPRIVTITRLVHDVAWFTRDGEEAESEVTTLGGRVDDVAQRVHGQARLRHGEPLLLFLGGRDDDSRRVVGMAQGEFLLRGAASDQRLERSPELPPLYAPAGRGPAKPAAAERLHLLGKQDARTLVERAFEESR